MFLVERTDEKRRATFTTSVITAARLRTHEN